ncbi:hypothetical protein GALL_523440 [mine drainage metagenome]|uniref:Uncharacterized protein n=1 Tax=mine drainage metagenome TaxID=410659 RepID=A0A1J5PLD4_9ZZZZ
MAVTVGGLRVRVYTCPVNGKPLNEGVTPVLLTIFNPSVPLPLPVLAVTVQVVPLPVTPVMAGVPLNPPLTSAKLLLATPLTLALKVTVQDTLAALVGLVLAVLIDWTVTGNE